MFGVFQFRLPKQEIYNKIKYHHPPNAIESTTVMFTITAVKLRHDGLEDRDI